MQTDKLVYEQPRLIELGDAAILTEGCNATGKVEADCGKSKDPNDPADR